MSAPIRTELRIRRIVVHDGAAGPLDSGRLAVAIESIVAGQQGKTRVRSESRDSQTTRGAIAASVAHRVSAAVAAALPATPGGGSGARDGTGAK